MRKLRTTLSALAATAAAVGGGLVGAPAAQAAATWQAHDKICKTFTDANAQRLGSACAEVQKRVTDAGSVNGYRGRVTVNPTAGNWMKPTTYVFSSELGQVCSGGCARQTSAWTSAWSPVETWAGTYEVRGELPGGYTFDVAASWSSWAQVAKKCATYAAGKFCVYRHERGYRDTMQERAKLTVTPAAGKWIEPRWVRVGTVMNGTNTFKTRELCEPSCTRRTATWSATVARTIPGLASPLQLYASAQVALPSGGVKTIKASLSD
ncbi:hypothetical protein JIX56_26525 [Streptomyces sp. CA-210063]|uniref:hypothetical protein n=1 Tax=Streptomyces sp. CA-210063 TaxID=2801029 RepID=UPI00214C4DEC|nr:hypothetical protein [Streptomyces sp. CA-210063]UUU33138.1 hypothetical protein JIX56_26525 [Streptomyces sp. CA-210063]